MAKRNRRAPQVEADEDEDEDLDSMPVGWDQGEDPEDSDDEHPEDEDSDDSDEEDEEDEDSPGDEDEDSPDQPEAQTGNQPEVGSEGRRPSPETAPVQPGQDQPEKIPFRFRADGREFEVPEAVVTQVPTAEGGQRDYIVMPLDQFQRSVLPNVRDGARVRQQIVDLRRQLAERDPEKHPSVARAKAILSKMDELRQAGPDAISDWLSDLDHNWDLLQERAKNAELEAQLQSRQAGEAAVRELEQGGDEGVDEQELAQSIAQHLLGSLQGPEYRDVVNRLDARELMADLWEVRGSLVRRVTENDLIENPELEAAGLKVGDPAIDIELVERRIARAAALARRMGGTAGNGQPRKTAADVRKANDSAAGRNGNRPPATVRTGGSPEPGKRVPTYKNRAAFQRAMERFANEDEE